MCLKFDFFEWPSSAVGLFLMAIIGSDVRIHVNVRGKYFRNVIINTYFNKSLNKKQNN